MQSILLAMADYADDEGRNCYPSYARLAWKTGYSTRQVEKALAELAVANVIRRHGVWCWIRNHLRFQEGSEAWAKSPKTRSRKMAPMTARTVFTSVLLGR